MEVYKMKKIIFIVVVGGALGFFGYLKFEEIKDFAISKINQTTSQAQQVTTPKKTQYKQKFPGGIGTNGVPLNVNGDDDGNRYNQGCCINGYIIDYKKNSSSKRICKIKWSTWSKNHSVISPNGTIIVKFKKPWCQQ